MNKYNPKVLVAAPTSIVKRYIAIDWCIMAKNLTYPNYDILIVDNSIDENYHKQLRAYGFKVLHVSPKNKSAKAYVTESQNLIRDVFLKGNYDYLMSIEIDIIPPANVIEKLLSSKKDIVSVPYFIDFGKKSNLLMIHLRKTKGEKAHEPYRVGFDEDFDDYNGNVNLVYSNGIGCSLIKRHVLEKIKFRYGPLGYSDTYFYQDVWEAGLNNYVDTSMIAKHFNSDWFLNYDHTKSLQQ